MRNQQPTAIICLSPYSGGMELDAIKLAKKLSASLQIVMIAKKDYFIDKQRNEYLGYNGIKLETISFKSSLSLSIILNVRKIIKQYGIKNIIFFGASELKSLYFSFLGLDINLIVRHGTTKSHPKKDLFHRLIYSTVAYHVAISKHLSNNVKYIIPFGKKTKLVTIIPSMQKECSIKEKVFNTDLQLLHVGRITKGKGLKEALLACEILYENNIKFHLDSYGEMASGYEVEFNSFINSLEYKDSFTLCGFTNNIYDEYPKHDIFIFPTKGEGFGNVVMEAIAHGIIILSFDNTSITNFKEMGFHIHLATNGSVDELKEKLLYIANNLENERNLALENQALAKRFFAPQREVQEYINLLQ